MGEEVQEVVVDVTTKADPGEASVEEDIPVAEEHAQEPVEQPREKQPKEEEPKPQVNEDLERERKDKATLAYNLRESERQRKFVEEQLQKEREKTTRRELKDEHDVALSKIEHLREIDPDAWVRERERILEDRHRKELDQEREAVRTRTISEETQARQRRVEEKIDRDFPELRDAKSPLFLEARAIIDSRYTQDEAAHILATAPQVMYDIVESAHAKLKIKQLEAERADVTRKQRVVAQGAVDGQKKTGASVVLSKEQKEFCKRNDLKEEDYAKFVSKGRG
jgi:hypothetical protein